MEWVTTILWILSPAIACVVLVLLCRWQEQRDHRRFRALIPNTTCPHCGDEFGSVDDLDYEKQIVKWRWMGPGLPPPSVFWRVRCPSCDEVVCLDLRVRFDPQTTECWTRIAGRPAERDG